MTFNKVVVFFASFNFSITRNNSLKMCIGAENSNTFIDILASFCTSSAQQPCQSGSIQGPPHSQFHIRKKFAGLYALKKLCIESQHPKLTLYKKKLIRKRTGKPIKVKLGSNFVKKSSYNPK